MTKFFEIASLATILLETASLRENPSPVSIDVREHLIPSILDVLSAAIALNSAGIALPSQETVIKGNRFSKVKHRII